MKRMVGWVHGNAKMNRHIQFVGFFGKM